MIVPLHLKNVCVPPKRVAEVSVFWRFCPRIEPIDLVRRVAWHEAGHAVAWVLKGGTLLQTTIIPDGDEGGVLWGLTEYDVPGEFSMEEWQRAAFSGMGGAAICELAGTPDIDAIWEDIDSSVDALRVIYSDDNELGNRAIEVWIEVLKFFGTPRVWRTADAFARRLIMTVPSWVFRTIASALTICRLPVLRKRLRQRLVLPARGISMTGCVAMSSISSANRYSQDQR